MSNETLKTELWGKMVELEVVFETHPKAGITENQKKAYQVIKEHWNVVDESLDAVKAFCLERSPEDAEAIETESVFSYVTPQQLYIERHVKPRIVGLLCEYRFDTEMGIAVVFEDEHLKDVMTQPAFL